MAMSKPSLSIVIASCVGAPFIDRCLESLEGQVGRGQVECIVVDRVGPGLTERLEQEYPWLTVYMRPADESVPDLRKFGITQAKADYVAVIEEHCVAREDWVKNILAGIEEEPAAIGGVVNDAGYTRLTDWAVYFTEYNAYMPPVEHGETPDICAANCVYRRDLLQEHLPASGSGYWEAGLNKTLLAKGEQFLSDPELVVSHTGPFGLSYYLHQRYLFSRAFAGTRREHVSGIFKIGYVFLAPLLIPLLWVRTASRVFAKRRHIVKFLQVTPHMLPITATYVFGEWVGFLAGSGDSLKKIE